MWNEGSRGKGSNKGYGKNGMELKDRLKLNLVRLVLNWFNIIYKVYCFY